MKADLNVASYLPHKPPMQLIEKIIAITADTIHCQTCVSSTSVVAPMLKEQGLPNWFSLEFIAQAIAIWNSFNNNQKDQPPRMGMLLGARSLRMHSGYFSLNCLLDIQVARVMQSEKLGSFEGRISIDDQCMAEGRINVYQPDDEEIIKIMQGVF